MGEIHKSKFPDFFDAMISEMNRHMVSQGDSWWNDERVHIGDKNYPMGAVLDSKINIAAEDYLKYKKIDQLIDIANLCAMRWLLDKKG